MLTLPTGALAKICLDDYGLTERNMLLEAPGKFRYRRDTNTLYGFPRSKGRPRFIFSDGPNGDLDTHFDVKLEETPHTGYFHKDYLRYGYGTELVEYDPSLPFMVTVDSGTVHDSYAHACTEAAMKVWERAIDEGKEILLLLSGGLDSEVMARAFLLAGIPFKAVTYFYTEEWSNEFDAIDAQRFCWAHGIELHEIPFDPHVFFTSGEYRHYAEQYRATFPELLLHMKFLSEHSDYFCVMPGNIPGVTTVDGRTNFYLPIDQFYCYHRYFERTGTSGVAHFLIYTAEQMATVTRQDGYRSCFEFGYSGYLDKVKLYQEGGFPVHAREAKYTGLETMRRKYNAIGKHQLYALNEEYTSRYIDLMEIEFEFPIEESWASPSTVQSQNLHALQL